MQIIDTHQHLWNLEQFSYSWCGTIPELNRSFHLDDYLEATRGLEVPMTVFMEADVDEPFILKEAQYVLGLAGQANPIEGVVAAGRPEKDDFHSYLDRLAGNPKLKGIRRVLHTQPDDVSESKRFVDNIKLLAQYQLTFDICVLARQLPQAISLVTKCPEVSFILDHCGNPMVVTRQMEPWRSEIRRIADLTNVVCKISGIVVNADRRNWTAEDLRPYIEHVIEVFGWDRVIFGSDWPVCTLASSYRCWVETLTSIISGANETEKQRLFYDNAARTYRLG
jgi:predicted TIM-barrel fold metal-dependent hydrolase